MAPRVIGHRGFGVVPSRGNQDVVTAAPRGSVGRHREVDLEPDGRAPRELKRTCSFGYSLMNAQGLLDIAYIARQLGDDLWNWSAPNGGSIPAAVRFMFDHACSRDEWPFEQIESIDWRMVALMAQKANSMDPSHFDVAEMAHRLPANFDPITFSVVAPLHPFGAERAPAGAGG